MTILTLGSSQLYLYGTSLINRHFIETQVWYYGLCDNITCIHTTYFCLELEFLFMKVIRIRLDYTN